MKALSNGIHSCALLYCRYKEDRNKTYVINYQNNIKYIMLRISMWFCLMINALPMYFQLIIYSFIQAFDLKYSASNVVLSFQCDCGRVHIKFGTRVTFDQTLQSQTKSVNCTRECIFKLTRASFQEFCSRLYVEVLLNYEHA